MAQPTVTARPNTWAGTSLPMLYKLTSTNYSNAGYYMAVEIWDSVAASKIGDLKCYANASGVVTIDVSRILSSSLSTDNGDAPYVMGNSDKRIIVRIAEDINLYKVYYIKYQEIWTASSETQVDDVANLRYAIYGSPAQVDVQTASLRINSYSTTAGKAMILADILMPMIWEYPYTISAYVAVATSGYLAVAYKDGVEVYREYTEILAEGKAYRLQLFLDDNEGMYLLQNLVTYPILDIDKIGIYKIVNAFAFPAPTSWTDVGANAFSYFSDRIQANISTVGSKTFQASTPLSMSSGNTFYFHWAWYRTMVGGAWAGTHTIRLDFYLSAGLVQSQTYTFSATAFASSTVIDYIFEKITLTSDVDEFRIYLNAQISSGTGLYVFYPYPKIIKGEVGSGLEFDVIERGEECDNIVFLQWKNSLGGDQCFPFQVNQEYTWYYGDRKAKRLTLFAENLTLSEWEAIQSLNTLGELYRVPIVEMTSSTERTMSTIGQSVYVVKNSKVGVNVIGQQNTTNTKQKKHSAVVTIEYPELLLQ